MRVRIFSHAFLCVLVLFLVSASQASAKDEWINVRSKNFFLIGNAGEKEMRQVATRLEQFRETFRLVFGRTKLSTSIQTNVVVFKDDASYNPFRPKRADGKPDEFVAGYFQSGEDLNYITIGLGGKGEDAYSVIFHEYVHFIINTNFGRSEVPTWFNEGLAEYYRTFKIENDQKVTLGDIQSGHLYLLQQTQLIPLKDFFEVNGYTLAQQGNHSRGIFYAQAWALIHYLIQGNKGANTDGMNKFLSLVMNDVEPEKAFQETFQMDYAAMEIVLKKYVAQRKFQTSIVTFKNKLVFDTEMTTVPLSEAEANAYLGDLLYHTREYADAETYLQKSLALDPNSVMANTSLGLVKMRDRKFDEAKKHLEKAMTGDRKNHFVYYNYAYILSREGMDEFGYVKNFSAETAKKMREALQKAIEIKPDFTESYRLLGFINLVNNENLDESLVFLKKGLELQPGNQDYALLVAQIYLRQEKYKEAKEIAEKIVKTADEGGRRAIAQNLLDSINKFEEAKAKYDKQLKDLEDKGMKPPVLKKKSELSEAELAKIKEQSEINGLNEMIAEPLAGEKRVLGRIEKIVCARGEISYAVKTDTETILLSSKDFVSVQMIAMVKEAENIQVGCDAKMSEILTVITYLPGANEKAKSKGKVISFIFVPNFFKLKTDEEIAKEPKIYVVEEEPQTEANPNEQAEMEKQRREAMLGAIKQALRQPLEGEKREMGIVEKIECSGQSMFFYIKTETQSLKLEAKPKEVKFAAFTPEVAQMQIGCGAKMPNVPAVITYKTSDFRLTDTAKGDLIAVEFVPKSFKLE
jgi:tetratricopeptide (TPR) repeat protein